MWGTASAGCPKAARLGAGGIPVKHWRNNSKPNLHARYETKTDVPRRNQKPGQSESPGQLFRKEKYKPASTKRRCWFREKRSLAVCGSQLRLRKTISTVFVSSVFIPFRMVAITFSPPTAVLIMR